MFLTSNKRSHQSLGNYNIMSDSNQKGKSKGPSRKQVIVSMSMNNVERVMDQSNAHVANINRLLKDIKSEICADFICSDNKGIVTTTNKIASASDINTIEKYMKNFEDTNLSITADIIETVIKNTYIFDNTVLVFYS